MARTWTTRNNKKGVKSVFQSNTVTCALFVLRHKTRGATCQMYLEFRTMQTKLEVGRRELGERESENEKNRGK